MMPLQVKIFRASFETRMYVNNLSQRCSTMHHEIKKEPSRAWFRSTDLWVMGPARFHCATLLLYILPPTIIEKGGGGGVFQITIHGIFKFM
jgi:hypothetical protein